MASMSIIAVKPHMAFAMSIANLTAEIKVILQQGPKGTRDLIEHFRWKGIRLPCLERSPDGQPTYDKIVEDLRELVDKGGLFSLLKAVRAAKEHLNSGHEQQRRLEFSLERLHEHFKLVLGGKNVAVPDSYKAYLPLMWAFEKVEVELK